MRQNVEVCERSTSSRRLSSSSFSIPKQKHFYMFLNVSIVPLFNMPFSWFCFIILHITLLFFMNVGWLTVVQFDRGGRWTGLRWQVMRVVDRFVAAVH